jgi:hypothetical protein
VQIPLLTFIGAAFGVAALGRLLGGPAVDLAAGARLPGYALLPLLGMSAGPLLLLTLCLHELKPRPAPSD